MGSRLLRVAALTAAVLIVEWRLAPPAAIAADPEREAIPWAVMALMVPLVIGVWTFEFASPRPGLKTDTLWALVLGTFVYSILSLLLF